MLYMYVMKLTDYMQAHVIKHRILKVKNKQQFNVQHDSNLHNSYQILEVDSMSVLVS